MAQYVADTQLPNDDGAGSEVVTDEAQLSISNSTEVSIQNVRAIKLQPVYSISNSRVIQFEYTSCQKEVIDAKMTRLKLVLKIVDQAGNDLPLVNQAGNLPGGTCVIPVNSIGSAMFSSCEVKVNGLVVEGGDTMYAYKADFQNRLGNNLEVKKNQLQNKWIYHEPVKWDFLTAAEKNSVFAATELKPDKPHLNPFIDRWLRSKGSKNMVVNADLYADFFKEHKFLPANTTINIALTRQPDDNFALLTNQQGRSYQIRVVSAELQGEEKIMDSDYLDTKIQEMRSGKPYRTNFQTCDVLRFTSPPGLTEIGENNIFKLQSYSPNNFSLVLVDQDAYNGDNQKCPFAYKLNGVRYVEHKRSDGNTRHLPFEMGRWGNAGEDVDDGVSNLYTALDMLVGPEEAVGIDANNFAKGHAFLSFNLKKALAPNIFSMPDKAVNSLVVKCTPALPNAIAKIIYAEYDTEVLIDGFGNVTVRKNALA